MVQQAQQAQQAQKVILEIELPPETAELVKEAARLHFGLDEDAQPDLSKYIRTLLEEDVERIVEGIKAREAGGG